MNKAIADCDTIKQAFAAGQATEADYDLAVAKVLDRVDEYASTREGAAQMLEIHTQALEAGDLEAAERSRAAIDRGARIAREQRVAENYWRAEQGMAPSTSPLPLMYAEIEAEAVNERRRVEENHRKNQDPLGLRAAAQTAGSTGASGGREWGSMRPRHNPWDNERATVRATPADGAPTLSRERQEAQHTASKVLAGQPARIDGHRPTMPEPGGILDRRAAKKALKNIAQDPSAPEPAMVKRYKGWANEQQVLGVARQLREVATPYFEKHPIGEFDKEGNPQLIPTARMVESYVRANLQNEMDHLLSK